MSANKTKEDLKLEIEELKETIRSLNKKLKKNGKPSLPPLKDRLINYFRRTPVAIQLFDSEGGLCFCNSIFSELVGLEENEQCHNLLESDTDYGTTLRKAFKDALEGHATRLGPDHVNLNQKNNLLKPIWILSSIYSIIQEQTSEKYVVVTIENISRDHKIDIGYSDETKRILLALENSGDGIWEYKPVTKEVFYNNRMFTMLGYQPNEIPHTYTTFSRLIHREDVRCYKNEIRNFLYHPENHYDMEFRLKQKDGSYRWVLFRGMAVEWDEKGKVTRIIGTMTDIQSIKEVKEKYEEQRLRLSMAVTAANDGTWDWDVQTGEVHFDDRYYTLAGYKPNEFPFKVEEFQNRVHPEDLKKIHRESASQIEGKEESYSAQFRYLHKNGEYMWLLSRSKIFEYAEDGTAKRIVGTHTDISHLKKIEASLKQSNDELKQAKIILERQNRFQEALLDAIPNAVFYKDMNGDYLGCNRAFSKFMNVSKEDLLGKEIEDMWPEEDAEYYRERDNEIYKTLQRQEYEYSISMEGNKLDLIVNKDIFYDEIGAPAGVVGIVQNISERKTWERNLKKSEELYRLVTENSNDVIYFLDKDLNKKYVSPSIYKILGFSENEWYTVELSEFMYPEDIKDYNKATNKWINDVKSREYFHFSKEVQMVRKDGTKIWTELSLNSMFDNEKNVIGIIGTAREITLKKYLEEESKKLRDLLDNIIDSMPSIIIGVDENTRITHWNTEAVKLTAKDQKEVINKGITSVITFLPNLYEKIMEAISSGEIHVETRIPYKKDSVKLSFDVTIYPLRSLSANGAVIRLDDVTERVKIDQMIVQSEKMLSVGGLAAGMAHEINNPLAGILQNIQVINNRLSTDLPKNIEVAKKYNLDLKNLNAYMEERSIYEMMNGIVESGKRASQIVSNMLSFSRKGESRYSSYDIHELINNTIDLAANDYDLKKKYDFRRITIEKDFGKDIPIIPCESSKIQQVLFNLIKNSAEAMYENLVEDIESTLRIETRIKNKKLQIKISDNGPGMDDDTKKRVFEPFFTTKEVGVGTGLGLSVSYFIITEDHKGEMSVDSAIGEGTIFTIHLPYKNEGELKRW